MAWLEKLKGHGSSVDPAIRQAFETVKREDFLPADKIREAGSDRPIGIGFGQTNSQPSTVIFMLELLAARPGDKILDVGCGTGWTSALLASIVGADGRVFGLELIAGLLEAAKVNAAKYPFCRSGRLTLSQGDGNNGLPESAPLDKILVSAAAREVPASLVEQLRVGGRLVIPIGEPYGRQDLVVIDKTGEEKSEEKRYPGFIFVPLIKN
jgi:protein-L-isoaspartate(D-aspartate) O-methyltransferase